MTAIFKADEQETDEKYSVSEWWLEPNTKGPGAHQHQNNEKVFYVLEGCCSFLIGDQWTEAGKGTFLRIPAKTMHDFANRTDQKTGILNFYIPGGFERNMPPIVEEVFEAFIDPSITTKFWFTKSSGPLKKRNMVS